MFGLGPTELIIILAVLILLFGATKIPQLARSLGRSVGEFKRGLSDQPEDASKKKEGADGTTQDEKSDKA